MYSVRDSYTEWRGDAFVTKEGIEIRSTYHVEIVGMVKRMYISGAFIEYKIDDHTGGSIIVKQYIEADVGTYSGITLFEFKNK